MSSDHFHFKVLNKKSVPISTSIVIHPRFGEVNYGVNWVSCFVKLIHISSDAEKRNR